MRTKLYFIDEIQHAKTLDRLNYLIELAADEIDNNNDYEQLYKLAIDKAHELMEV